MAPPHTDLPIRVLACDELGYVRAFATDPAAGGDAAEDLTLIGKFGALDRARRAVRAPPPGRFSTLAARDRPLVV